MTAVQNSQISSTRLWSSFGILAIIKNLISGIVSSHIIIYIDIHEYSAQLKLISVGVIEYFSLFCRFR